MTNSGKKMRGGKELKTPTWHCERKGERQKRLNQIRSHTDNSNNKKNRIKYKKIRITRSDRQEGVLL